MPVEQAIELHTESDCFDPGESNYRDGYQCPPVNRGINMERKREFFAFAMEITGF